MNMIAVAEKSTITVAEYSETETALAILRERYGTDIVWDLSTTKGMDAAKKARYELKTLRTSLDKKREELKSPLLQQGKLLDSECKRITSLILELEKPLDEKIKAEEARKEEKKAAEKERVAAILKKIKSIRNTPVEMVGKCSDDIQNAFDTIINPLKCPDEFAELVTEAALAHARATDSLAKMLEAAKASESETKRIQEERERFAEEQRRLRQQQQEENDRRQREHDERMAELQRQEAALLKAQQEQERLAAEERAKAAVITTAITAPVSAPVTAQDIEPVQIPPATVERPSDKELDGAVAAYFSVSMDIAHIWLSTYGYSTTQVAA